MECVTEVLKHNPDAVKELTDVRDRECGEGGYG